MTSKKITELVTKTALDPSDWITGVDVSEADPSLQNIKITKANLQAGLATDASVTQVASDLSSHESTNAKTAHPDGINQSDLTAHRNNTNQHPISGVTGLQAELDAKADSSSLGTSASRDVGTAAGDVAAGDAPANAVAAHESTYNHDRIPTSAQKDALDNAPTLADINPVASMADIVDEGIAMKSTGIAADQVLVTDGLDGFAYEDKATGGGATQFVDLTDTPASYAGQQGKLAQVNPTEDGIIFGDASGTTTSWGSITGTISDQTDLQAELDAKLGNAPSDGNHYGRRDGSWEITPVTPIGAVWTRYTWSSNTSATSPPVGGIKVNNSNHTLATALYVHELTGGGNNADSIWGSLQAGDYLGVWEEQSDREGIYYSVTGPPTDNTGWWTVPIAVVPGSVGGMENGQVVNAFTIFDPRNRNPVGGTTRQALLKASGADHDTEWGDLTASDVGAATAAQGALADTAVQPARAINAGTGLSGGGDLSQDRTLNLADTAVSPGAYSNTNLVVDAQGRITSASNGTGSSVSTGFERTYNYNSTVGTPTWGELRMDAAQGSESELRFNAQDVYNAYLSSIVANLAPGDYITMADASGNVRDYDVSGAVVDNGSWYTVPVILVDNSLTLSNGQPYTCLFTVGVGSGGGVGPDVQLDGYTETEDLTLTSSGGTLTVPLDGRPRESTLSENTTMAATPPGAGIAGSCDIVLVQAATAYMLAYPAGWLWPDGTPAEMPTGDGDRLYLSLIEIAGTVYARGQVMA